MRIGPNAKRLDAMPVVKELSLGSSERNVVGVIVTAREQTTDERITLHKAGTPREALVLICHDLDEREGDWRILVISTPATIFRDLQGTRLIVGMDRLVRPEHEFLARIGRRDLMDPSIYPHDLSKGGRSGGLWGDWDPGGE